MLRNSGGVGTPRGTMLRNSRGVSRYPRGTMFCNSRGVGRYGRPQTVAPQPSIPGKGTQPTGKKGTEKSAYGGNTIYAQSVNNISGYLFPVIGILLASSINHTCLFGTRTFIERGEWKVESFPHSRQRTLSRREFDFESITCVRTLFV